MCGGWGRKAALCGMPRFLRLAAFLAAFGPLATLAGWGALGRAVHAALCGIPRFLRPLGRSQCLRGWGALGREGHAALCSMPRFLRPLGRSQRLRRAGCGGVGCMPRFATCRVSCGLRAARNACFFVLRHRDLGRCPKPRQGDDPPAPRSFPLHPALSPLLPYLTTRFLSLRISSVTPSGGSPNVALSVLLPPSHVSCIAISRASIRQPSSTTVTTSPTS